MQRFLFLLCTLSSSKCNSMDLWRSCSSSCKRYFCQIGKGFDHQFNSMEGREAKRHALSRYAQNSTYYNRWHSVFRHEFISLIWLRERDVICQAARLAMRHISPNEYRVVITAIVVSCLLEGSVNTVTSKQGLLRLANHLADFQFSSNERQSFLMQAKTFPLDLQALLKELITLRRNALINRFPIKWYK